jgi:hypothetical protein
MQYNLGIEGTPTAALRLLPGRQNSPSIALRSPDYANWAMSFGSEIGGGTSQEFAALIQSELQRWGKIAEASGVRME